MTDQSPENELASTPAPEPAFPPAAETNFPPMVPSAAPVAGPPSKWPTVLGMFHIVYGSLTGLMIIFGLISTLVMLNVDSPLFDSPQFNESMDVARKYLPINLISSVLQLGLGIMVLFGGIRLVKRRAKAIALLTRWAWLALILGLPIVVMGMIVQSESWSALQGALRSQGQFGDTVMLLQMAFAVAFSLVWYFALPVFTLIWLRRLRIIHESKTWD